jgi:MraZ protein
MLLGEYTHTLDPKKRLSLPSKFRKEMGKTVVLTQGLDKCLFLYSVKQWGIIAGKLSESSTGQSDVRDFNRFMLAGAVELEVDSLGRILVPDFLKDFAGLSSKVVITGVHSRAEIWDDVRWGEYKKKIGEQADALAQKLGELGVF